MDIKKWFEEGTGLKIQELRYLTMPPLPYDVFVDDTVYRGADLKNNIIEHNVIIEHYSEKVDKENESIIETFLNNENKQFEKNREWLQDEKLFVTVYELETFLEKVRKENIENE